MLNEGRKPFEDPNQKVKYFDVPWLEKQWEHFNKKFFGGKLKKPKELIWYSEQKRRAYGICGADFDGKKYFTTYIKISSANTNYQTFKNTLVHEMVHQWVNETYVTEDVIRMANSYGKARSRKWWNYVDKAKGAGADAHHGTWLTKCDEIMELDPTLNLKKYGSRDETKITDKEKEKFIEKYKTAHLVVQEGSAHSSRRHVYFITDEAFQDLLKDIQSGVKDGKWTEYKFDPEKMADEKKEPNSYIGTRYFIGPYLDNLCERGIVDEWNKKVLGGEKISHRRKQHRLWW